MTKNVASGPYRAGGNWKRTLILVGKGKPDRDGRRKGDTLVGMLDTPKLTDKIVELLNENYRWENEHMVSGKELREKAVKEGRSPGTLQMIDRLSPEVAKVKGDAPPTEPPTMRTRMIEDLNARCVALADWMIDQVSDGDDLKTGLQRLVEAQDWFQRAIIAETKDKG
jgi:hypothetical protein